MKPISFISTTGDAPEASLSEALFRGLAPDGGLYMPARLPRLSAEELTSLPELDWPQTATLIADKLLEGAMAPEEIRRAVREAFDFPLPIVRLSDRLFLLDLSQGPTLAFKDVGARFMARLLAHFRQGERRPLTVLTATSGDTGGAVAHALLGLAGIRVVVLFPDGKVTPRQERQFSTLGRNVEAVAVQGDFDDCQRMAKDAFRDERLRDAVGLTSANSINIGRFLPQSFYYFHALSRCCHREVPTRVLFSVPSGNFGNLAAGLLAKAMGLGEVGFVAATNANDVFPELLRTGRFRPRPSRRTLSTAMDVGNPSNLSRILHLYEGDLHRLRRDVRAVSVGDAETGEGILRADDRFGHVLDPHTAVGYVALEAALEACPEATGILLKTADPGKFAEVVEPVVGRRLPVPQALARGLAGSRKVTALPPDSEAVKAYLRKGVP